MQTLRTPEIQQAYEEYLANLGSDAACALCSKPSLQQFEHWRIVVNDFPYERIAARHDMLIPLRHVTEDELSEAEQKEFRKLKKTYCNDHYDYMIEPVHKGKSIPEHFHLHLIVAKLMNSPGSDGIVAA